MPNELLVDLYKDAMRQGPGGITETLKALSFFPSLGNDQTILDIGCGTGAQTEVLAIHTPCYIVAVDIMPEFLEKLTQRIKKLNLSERVSTVVSPMDQLPFENESFDLIWAEGSIYIMGFEEGLRQWKRLLKPDGYIAVSEISWFTAERPPEVEAYWEKEYSLIDSISNKTEQILRSGFLPIAHFILPESCWIDNYYNSVTQQKEAFLQKHCFSPLSSDLVKSLEEEIDFYMKYKQYYGYVFYIAQKIG